MPLSDHADSVAILRLVHGCKPEAVLLVHGTAVKMKKLRKRIEGEVGVRCFCPANGELVGACACAPRRDALALASASAADSFFFFPFSHSLTWWTRLPSLCTVCIL